MSTKKLQIIGSLSSDGVYVGSGDMPDGYNVQIDPTGDDTYSLLPAVTADDNGKVAIVQNGEWAAAVMDAQSDITIDSELSTTSTNPVQNKVVKSAIDNISTLIGDSSVSEQISSAIVDKADSEHTHTVSEITDFSTNMIAENVGYTQADEGWTNVKQALDGLENYLLDYGAAIDDIATYTHTHANKVALDKITESSDGEMLYNGQSLKNETITYSEATTSTSGLMSAADKQKIDGIEDGANKTTVDSALSSTSVNPVQNKVVKSAIDGISTLVGDTSVSSQITNAIDLLDLSNTYIAASQKGAASGVAELDSSGKVPSSQLNAVTKSDIGLGNVDNTSDVSKPISTATQTALNNKVDKITGKSLSTNDYTTAEKTKLAGIEEGATKYTHPTGDGNLHVPATGTSNSGKVLKAGSTAGSISWGSLSKSDVGLGNVDNTSDANKPISNATQTALNAKQGTITGAATTITGSNLTASRVLVSDSSGKVAVSDITATELGYLDGVTSNIQTQISKISSPFSSGAGRMSAQGCGGTANGQYSLAVGDFATAGTSASNLSCFALGHGVSANNLQMAVGRYNSNTTGASTSGTAGSVFVVGTGTSGSGKNGFRVSAGAQCYGASSFNASGADYAEYEEWLDGNPNNEDRRGLFVTYEGDKIRLANAEDDYIAGIVSAAPSVVGDVQSEEWQCRFLKDVFGAMITETVEIEDVVDEDGNVIPAHTETRFVINPDYDPTREYVSREYRQEWDMVGYVGKLVVVDDGTCQVNGYCKSADGGIATASDKGYRVLKRIDETHIKVRIGF